MKCPKSLSVCVLLFGLLTIASASSGDCNKSESPVMCHGTRVIRNVVHHVLRENSDNPLKLVPGLEIVESDNANEIDARAATGDDENTWSGRVTNYLQTHELKINFKDLLMQGDFKDVIATAMKSIDEGKGVVGELKI